MIEQWSWPLTPTEWVATATIALAAVTAWLAVTTRRMANTARQEVAAQWRPALIPGKTEAKDNAAFLLSGTTPPIIGGAGRVLVAIYNAGSGPALNVDAALTPLRPAGPRLQALPLKDAQVILAGQQRFLPFAVDIADMDAKLVVTCKDLAGVSFMATMKIHRRPQPDPVVDAEGNLIPNADPRIYWFDDFVSDQSGSRRVRFFGRSTR